MQPAILASSPCDKLSQACLYFQKAWPAKERTRMAAKLLTVFKDNLPLFNANDVDKLQEVAKTINQESDHNSELVATIRELADRLKGYQPTLPSAVFGHILSFLSLSERAGMHISCKQFWALAHEPSYLASILHRADRPLPLDHLKKLLATCGAYVLELDLSRLLTTEERKNLTSTQLQELLTACPQLQRLTLTEAPQITTQELAALVTQAPQLKELIVAACRSIPNLDAIKTARPDLTTGFSDLGSNQLHMAISLMKRLRIFLDSGKCKNFIFERSPSCMLLRKISELSRSKVFKECFPTFVRMYSPEYEITTKSRNLIQVS